MMYSGLAEVYDLLADDFDYDAWAARYADMARGAKNACECGCGTGSVTVRLARMGYHMTGVDCSEDMLRVAAEKARKAGQTIRFVCQDMCALALTKPVDAVLCPCDGVNYLLTLARVERFFARAYASLAPGGALAFDISTERKLARLGKTGLYGENRETAAYLWANAYDPKSRRVTMDIVFFRQTPNGLFERFSETHVQRAHRAAELIPRMESAGFTDIITTDSENGDRLFFRAVKPSEGI